MKKLLIFILAIALCFTFCSCGVKSPEDELAEAIRRSEQSKKAADAAKDAYDKLLQDIEDYENALEKVNGAK